MSGVGDLQHLLTELTQIVSGYIDIATGKRYLVAFQHDKLHLKL